MKLFRIVISLDGQVVKSVDIDDRQYFVGRGEDNDIILDNKKVSRSHAKLSVHGKILIIEDLGSINGIYFDGRKVKKANLVTGDVVKIPPYVLHLETVNMAIDEKPCLNGFRQSEETRQVTVYSQDGNTFNVELIPGKSKLGRSLDNDIIINDPSVSRWHAEITNTGDAVTVLDMASTSGTYIDGEKITSSRWLPGKTLNLGRVKLELSFVSTDMEEQLKSPMEIQEKPIVTLGEKHRNSGKTTKVLAGVAIFIFFISGWWVVSRYLLFNDKNVSNITEIYQEKTALNGKQSAANIAIGKNQIIAKIENAQKIAEMEAKAKLLILLVDEAKKAIEAKKWRAAINSSRRALEISSGNQEVEKLLNYAKEAQAKKDKIALQKADKEHMKRSKYAERMSRYYSAIRGEKYSEAVQEAQKAIALYPNRREAQKALAKGKEYLAKQIQIKRETQKQKNRIVLYAKKHYEAGLKFKKQGNNMLAMKEWNKLINLDPQMITPYPNKVRPLLAEIKQKLNKGAEAQVAVGRDCENKGDVVGAILKYRQAIKLAPWNEKAKMALASADLAINKIIKDLYTEGRALASLGDIGEALEKWYKALTLAEPNSNEAVAIKEQIRKYSKGNNENTNQ